MNKETLSAVNVSDTTFQRLNIIGFTNKHLLILTKQRLYLKNSTAGKGGGVIWESHS